MVTKRKPTDETDEQREERQVKTKIANHANRSEKTAWNRKLKTLSMFVEREINPIEDNIMELRTELEPLYDEVMVMREDLVQQCIHPYDDLVYDRETKKVTCRFCDKNIAVHQND